MALLTTTAAVALIFADLYRRTRRAVPRISSGRDAQETLDVILSLGGHDGFLPTPWLGGMLGGHFQTLWYGLKPDEPSLGSVDEEYWRTSDGGTVGLAWPACDLPASSPVCLVLPGLCGSVRGSGHTVKAVLDAGMRPVVLHSRGCGHPLTSPRFNLFGDTDDLRDAIARITASYPCARITLYGVSAGTGLLVRYLGEEGSRTRVVAGVVNCPGYDIGVALARCRWVYDSAYYVSVLKRHWLSPANLAVLEAYDANAVRLLQSARTLHDFMVASSPFAVRDARPPPAGSDGGAGSLSAERGCTFAAYLSQSNPIEVAHQITVPCLVVNADDDPICCKANVDDNAQRMLRAGAACSVLMEMPSGGHCAFAAGWRAVRWFEKLGARFLAEFAARSRADHRTRHLTISWVPRLQGEGRAHA